MNTGPPHSQGHPFYTTSWKASGDVEGGDIIGANTTDAALDQFRFHLNGDRLISLGIEGYMLRKDYVRTSPEETAEMVKLVIVPYAIDVDGCTQVVPFGETN